MTTAQRTTRGFGRTWRLAGVALAGGVAISAAAVAQPEQNGGEAPPSTTVLVLERAELSRFIVDERDAGLARALGMVPARLRELPREIPDFKVPPHVLDLVLTILSRPARIAITFNPQDPSGGGFGAGLVASIDVKDREQAAAMHGAVSGLLAQSGAPFQWAPSETFGEMSETFLPFGMLRYGPRQVGGDWRWEVHFGSLADPDTPFESLPQGGVAGDFKPYIRARLDPAPLAPLLNMAKMFVAGQPEAERAFNQLTESGLIGPEAISYEFEAGYLPDRSVTTYTMRGARKYARHLHLSTEPLSDAAIAAIPADATAAWVGRFDLSNLIEQAIDAAESDAGIAAGLEKFKAETGIDLLGELVPSLGDTAGIYFSDSTGGAKLGSLVLFLSLKDADTFRAANAKLASAIRVALAQKPSVDQRLRIRTWTQDGAEFHTLVFVGIPFPLELTYAITDSMVVFGLTPQAVVAGTAQASGRGDKGLASNPAFADALPRGKKFVNVSFIDTASTMRSGYQYVSFAGSALANAVRSPVDRERDPGLIVPPFSELSKGVRARVSFCTWEGDDFVKTTYGNRSVLADMAGVVGAAEPLFPVVAGLIGGLGAAIEKAEQRRHDGVHWNMHDGWDDDDWEDDDVVQGRGDGAE